MQSKNISTEISKEELKVGKVPLKSSFNQDDIVAGLQQVAFFTGMGMNVVE